MGWEIRRTEVIARLDCHGGEEQERDRKLWEELREELRKVADQDKYKPLSPDVW